MTTRVTIALLLASAAVCVPAAAAPADETFPHTGQIKGNNIYVRSGPNLRAYPVAKLSAPARVTVIGRSNEWLRIAPPAGVFSVISKQYVKLSADGTTGTISGDRVRVRAGSDLVTLGDITKHWAFQRHLNAGDVVTIVGEGGDFYKIAPPDRVVVWISAEYVSSGVAGSAALPPLPRTTADRPRPPSSPADAAPAPDAVASVAAFDEAEKVLAIEYKKPFDQRDFESVLENYLAIRTQPGTPLGAAVGARIRSLRQAIDRRRRLQAALDNAKEIRQRHQELRDRRDALAKSQPPLAPKRPLARGVLEPSLLFPGGARPQRFVLRDPDSGVVNAFVQSAGGRIDLKKFTGKLVGVYGTVTRDDAHGRDSIEAEKIEILDPTIRPIDGYVAPPSALQPEPEEDEEEGETAEGEEQEPPPADEPPAPVKVEPTVAPPPLEKPKEAADDKAAAAKHDMAAEEKPVKLIPPETEEPAAPDKPTRPTRSGPGYSKPPPVEREIPVEDDKTPEPATKPAEKPAPAEGPAKTVTMVPPAGEADEDADDGDEGEEPADDEGDFDESEYE